MISGGLNARQPDPNLCRLISQARYWFDLLASGKAASVQEIALREGVFVTGISRIIPLAFLAPVIVEDILQGRQPEPINISFLKRAKPLSFEWNEQHIRLRYPT